MRDNPRGRVQQVMNNYDYVDKNLSLHSPGRLVSTPTPEQLKEDPKQLASLVKYALVAGWTLPSEIEALRPIQEADLL